MKRIATGKSVTRRERQQLTRTAVDTYTLLLIPGYEERTASIRLKSPFQYLLKDVLEDEHTLCFVLPHIWPFCTGRALTKNAVAKMANELQFIRIGELQMKPDTF
ncbi:hypothetical protein R1sor_015505 [Riccia sorocarpa]|uniref:Uncharacterized protein n=1 Tax=Riccia sorocarpa TaxID=122646 RepID=A0ABD3HED4_9MARC